MPSRSSSTAPDTPTYRRTAGPRPPRDPALLPALAPDPPAPSEPIVAPIAGPKIGGLAPIARSKIQPPAVRDATLPRERLLSRLAASTVKRLTLVVAEAGYGKTTLLADFGRRGQVRCLWYRLDSSDRDWITLTNYLIGALREVEPSFGQATSRLLSQMATLSPPRELVVGSLMAELSALSDRRLVLILDDFHLVDESEEARDTITRLVRDAPPQISFVISTRRRPSLPLARFAAQGELDEIGTTDLRFSRGEVGRLFADAYGQPLDDDLITDVDRRTEGWVASLQLLYSSIRGRPASAVRSFIHSMSGAERPIFDFLAEEVLGKLEEELERFLVHASLLERIEPDLVVALFEGDTPPSLSDAKRWIDEADELALLSRDSASSDVRHFHPLLRDFLLRQLRERVPPADVRRMHLRVARAAEAVDWLASSYHYIEAGEPQEAMRVLGDSALVAIGSGRWGAASDLLDRLEEVRNTDPAIDVIRARRLIAEGRVASALDLLRPLDSVGGSSLTQALVRQARATAAWRTGSQEGLSRAIDELAQDPNTPDALRDIAKAFSGMRAVESGGRLADYSRQLVHMAKRQAARGYYHYSGVSLHNAAHAAILQGEYQRARELGVQALDQFAKTRPTSLETASTRINLAISSFELGQMEEGGVELSLATADGLEDADVHAEGAMLMIALGEPTIAKRMIHGAERLTAAGRSDIAGNASLSLAKASLLLANHDFLGALDALVTPAASNRFAIGSKAQRLALEASALLLRGERSRAEDRAVEGLALATAQGAHRHVARLRVLVALAEDNRDELAEAIVAASMSGTLALLENADALAAQLHLLEPVQAEIHASIRNVPRRWLPLLRRALERGDRSSGNIALELLSAHGSMADVPRVRAYERMYRRRTRPRLARALARRASPRLTVRDLGRVELAVGDRRVALAEMRRKAGTLLMYLVTRPNRTATREQVIESLWPDAEPAAAANSLNQTLYFLRRDIDPWYEDGISVDYVAYESELLWIDETLVEIESVAFFEGAARFARTSVDVEEAAQAVGVYTGRFAPEFEYEDWAIGWRDRVHAAYLGLAHAVAASMAGAGRLYRSVDVLSQALNLDPSSLDLEASLVAAYHRLGADSAALEQYRHFAHAYRAELGSEPPTYQELTQRPAS